MPRLLLPALVVAVGLALGLLVHPLWLLGVPLAVVAAAVARAGLDLERFLQATGDDGDAGRGPAGVGP